MSVWRQSHECKFDMQGTFPRLLFVSFGVHLAAFTAIDISPSSQALSLTAPVLMKLAPVVEHAKEISGPVLPQKIVDQTPPRPEKNPLPDVAPKPEPVKETIAEVETYKTADPVPSINPEARANYEALLLAWLDRHKRYPVSARRRGLEGQALVHIRIARNGEVLYSELVQSTGTSVLDRELDEMVTRANPFPPMPQNYPGHILEFKVPVRFQLN